MVEKDEKHDDLSGFKMSNLLRPEMDDEGGSAIVIPFRSPDELQKDDEPDEVVKDEKKDEVVKKDEPEVVKDDTKPSDDSDDEVDFTPFFEKFNEVAGLPSLTELTDEEKPENSLEGMVNYFKDLAQNTANTIVNKHDEVSKLYEFMENGGKAEDFFKLYNSTEINYDSVDLEDTSNQKLLVEQLYKLKFPKLTEERRKEKITKLEDSGDLESEAKDALDELKETELQRKEKVLAEQKEKAKEAETNRINYWNGIKDTITKSEDLGGFKIKEADKMKFYKYISEVGKDGLTEHQRKAQKNPNSALVSAYLDFINYDIESVKRSVKTDVTKDIKKTLTKIGDTQKKTNSKDNNMPSTNGEVDGFKSIFTKLKYKETN